MSYCTRTRHGYVDETTPGGRVFSTCRQHARRRRAPHPHASPAEHYTLLRLLDDQAGQRSLRGRSRTRRISWLLQRIPGRSHLRPTEPLVVPPPTSVGPCCTPGVEPKPEPDLKNEGSAEPESVDVEPADTGTTEAVPEPEGVAIDLTATEGVFGVRSAKTASAALASLAAHRAPGRKARP